MQVSLRFTSGKHQGQEVAVRGDVFHIGRGESCHLRPASEVVSRKHCTIEVADDRVAILDLGSANGTLVNGERISGRRELRHGDEVRVGPLEFRLVIPQPAIVEAKPRQQPVAAASKTAIGGTKAGASGVHRESDIMQWLSDDESPDQPELAEAKTSTPQQQQKQTDTVSAHLSGTHSDGERPASTAQPTRAPSAPPPVKSPDLDAADVASTAVGEIFDRIAKNKRKPQG